jgi:hypothetical protein
MPAVGDRLQWVEAYRSDHRTHWRVTVLQIGGSRQRSLTVGAIGHANWLQTQVREGSVSGSELGYLAPPIRGGALTGYGKLLAAR